MRLDKYLKTARILKKRTVSKELADNERVLINGKVAKPSSEVKVGDEIIIQFGNRELGVKVLSLQKQASKEVAATMFEVLYENRVSSDKDIENVHNN